jgi:hypothetical protein
MLTKVDGVTTKVRVWGRCARSTGTEESSQVESVPPPADLQLAPNPRNVEN